MRKIEALYLALRMIKKRLVLNIVLFFQLLLCMILLFTLVGKVQYNLLTYNILNVSGVNNFYYLYLYDQFLDNPGMPDQNGEKSDELLKKLQTIDEITGVGEIKTLPFEYKNNNSNGTTLGYIYNEALIKNIQCNLKDGMWFDKYQAKNGIVPIIVSDDMGIKLNDSVEFSLLGPNTNQSKLNKYRGVVIGILNDLNYMFTFGKGGTMMGMDTLISKEKSVFLIPEISIEPQDSLKGFGMPGKMVFTDKKTESLNNRLSDLSLGNVTEIKKMKEVTQKDFVSFLLANGLIFIVFTLITIAGVGGNNGLLRLTNEKNFSVYYIVGFSWKQCIRIELWRTVFIIGTPFLAFIILYLTNGLERFYTQSSAVVNLVTFAVIFIYTVIIYLLTSIGFIISLSKSNPVEIIRRWE